MSADGETWESLSDDCAGSSTPAGVLAGQVYTFRLTATDNTSNTASAEDSAFTSAVTKYYYLGSQRVAVRKPDGAVNWLHGDHLGSTSLATDADGQQVSRQLYYPFGEVRWASAEMPTDFGYTGQRLDGTGLMFYHARYYAPVLGRFISADSIVPELGNPQSLNRYSYVLNNPFRYTDPTGHDPCEEDPTGENCIVLSNEKVIRGIAEWEIWLLAAMAFFEQAQLGEYAMIAATRTPLNRLISLDDIFANQHSLLEVLEGGNFQSEFFQELLDKVSLDQGDANLKIIQNFMEEKVPNDNLSQTRWEEAKRAARSSAYGALNEPDITNGSLFFANMHHHWLDDYREKIDSHNISEEKSVELTVIEPDIRAIWAQGKIMVLNSVRSVFIPEEWSLPDPNATLTPTPL
jgi:RHS repeat-associated protein